MVDGASERRKKKNKIVLAPRFSRGSFTGASLLSSNLISLNPFCPVLFTMREIFLLLVQIFLYITIISPVFLVTESTPVYSH